MNKPPDGWVAAYKIVTRAKRRSPVVGRLSSLSCAKVLTYHDGAIYQSELKLSGRSCDKGIHAYPTFLSWDCDDQKNRVRALGLKIRDDKRYVILRVWAPSWYSPTEYPIETYVDDRQRRIFKPNTVTKIRAATVYVEKEVGYIERGGHWVNTERGAEGGRDCGND